MRRVVFVFGLALLAQPAMADVQDYCAAVARDFADLRPKDRDIWQQRYDGANADCVEQFTSAPVIAAVQPRAKKKVVAVKPSAPVVAGAAPVEPKAKKKVKQPSAEVATVEGAVAEPTAKVVSAKTKPAPGSAEWLDYCARKYTSFNREKGTYLSKTGVERKCLITADFR
jgi:hypothetical protein